MKITYQSDGGLAHIPALSGPVVIDTAQIDPQGATQLESLVRKSGFFNLPSRGGTAPKGADYRTYTITVEDGSRLHTVQLTDPITNVNLQSLLSRLRAMTSPRQ